MKLLVNDCVLPIAELHWSCLCCFRVNLMLSIMNVICFSISLCWEWTGLHLRNPFICVHLFCQSKNVEQLFLTPQNIMRKAVHYWWLFYVDAGFNLYNVALQHLSQLLDMEQVLSSVSQLRHKDVSLIHLNYRNLFHKFCDFSCLLLKQMELL